MKKLTAVLFIIFASLTTLSATEDLFSLSAGLSSGYAFYGSEEVKEFNAAVSGSHILTGGLATVNLNPFKEVTFFAGADLLCDFKSENKNHSNHLHLDFPFGIKIYPGLGGLNAGLAYTMGFRYDSVKIDDIRISERTSWGNGFKLLLEYNFAHDGKSKYYPTLGASWKCIPRGNKTYDNIICAYICANL